VGKRCGVERFISQDGGYREKIWQLLITGLPMPRANRLAVWGQKVRNKCATRPQYKYSITARWKLCNRFINSILNAQYLPIYRLICQNEVASLFRYFEVRVRYRKKKFTFAISSPDEFLSVSFRHEPTAVGCLGWVKIALLRSGSSGLNPASGGSGCVVKRWPLFISGLQWGGLIVCFIGAQSLVRLA